MPLLLVRVLLGAAVQTPAGGRNLGCNGLLCLIHSITRLQCHHSFRDKQADGSFNAFAEAFCSNYALQCGACTPGFITSTHAAIKKCHMQGAKPTVERIQQGLDGNLCRCTGYRPILDACRVSTPCCCLRQCGMRAVAWCKPAHCGMHAPGQGCILL